MELLFLRFNYRRTFIHSAGDFELVAVQFHVELQSIAVAIDQGDFFAAIAQRIIAGCGIGSTAVHVSDGPGEVATRGIGGVEFKFGGSDDQPFYFHTAEFEGRYVPFTVEGFLPGRLIVFVVVVFFAAVEARQDEQEKGQCGQVDFRKKSFHA